MVGILRSHMSSTGADAPRHRAATRAPARPTPARPHAPAPGTRAPAAAPAAARPRRVVPRLLPVSPFQRVAVVLSLVLGVRYFGWRLESTFNPDALALSWLYFVAEVFGFVEVVLFFATTWRRTAYPELPTLPDRTVDVFVATYNEPVELLRDTLVCAVGMRYPHRTFVLDDGARAEVEALAREIGCEYIARTDRTGAKAGNLNNALGKTDGEFVVTLDADHVPAPDLIDRMIGAFADADVGVVQANQDFYNLDSFQHDTDWRRRDAWQQQELFFNVIQPGKDAFNAAFYCGSPAMLRRSALENVRGFAHETITEDMHTSLRMHKLGLRSVYLNESVARGLAPQTFGGYVTQWLRWGEGALQVFRAENPLFSRGLTLGQRLCYFASTFFYLTAWQKLVFLVMPALCLLSGVFPLRTDARSYAIFFLPYMLLSLSATAMVQGGWRGFWRTEQFNLVKLTAQLRSIRGLWTKRGTFAVTPKTRAAAPAWTGLALHLVAMALLLCGVVAGALQARGEDSAERRWAYLVTGAFALYYVAMLVPVVRRALARREQRLTYRFPSHLDVRVGFRVAGRGVVRDGEAFARNLNRFGLSLTLDYELPRDAEIELQLQLPDRVVRATGSARWSEIVVTGGRRRVANGVRFERIDVSDQDEIARFLFWEVVPAHGRMLRMTRHEQEKARSVGEAA